MQRNTVTTLGQLQVGDRFHFPGNKAEVFEVTGQLSQTTCYNMPLDPSKPIAPRTDEELHAQEIKECTGNRKMKYDLMVRKTKDVIFLRHTRRQPNQECNLSELEEGDVFFLPDDIVGEYRVVDPTTDITLCLAEAVNDANDQKRLADQPVIFLRKGEAAVNA